MKAVVGVNNGEVMTLNEGRSEEVLQTFILHSAVAITTIDDRCDI